MGRSAGLAFRVLRAFQLVQLVVCGKARRVDETQCAKTNRVYLFACRKFVNDLMPFMRMFGAQKQVPLSHWPISLRGRSRMVLMF